MMKTFENLYNVDGSIKSYYFYCSITDSDYKIISTKVHLNTGCYIIGSEHRVKRLKDNEVKTFQDNDLKKRFTKVEIKTP